MVSAWCFANGWDRWQGPKQSCHKQVSRLLRVHFFEVVSPFEDEDILDFQSAAQMHAHVLILKPQLFPAPHFSQKELFHSPPAQPSPLQWSSALSPICCSPLPQMPSCFSQSSFAHQFLPLLPRLCYPVIQLLAENQPWDDFLFGELCPQKGGNQEKFLWKAPSIPTP